MLDGGDPSACNQPAPSSSQRDSELSGEETQSFSELPLPVTLGKQVLITGWVFLLRF